MDHRSKRLHSTMLMLVQLSKLLDATNTQNLQGVLIMTSNHCPDIYKYENCSDEIPHITPFISFALLHTLRNVVHELKSDTLHLRAAVVFLFEL